MDGAKLRAIAQLNEFSERNPGDQFAGVRGDNEHQRGDADTELVHRVNLRSASTPDHISKSTQSAAWSEAASSELDTSAK